jgi:hypothetical protein
MRKECDFSKVRKNPYASQLMKQVTIRLDGDSISYCALNVAPQRRSRLMAVRAKTSAVCEGRPETARNWPV